jgi:hypothetical protein
MKRAFYWYIWFDNPTLGCYVIDICIRSISTAVNNIGVCNKSAGILHSYSIEFLWYSHISYIKFQVWTATQQLPVESIKWNKWFWRYRYLKIEVLINIIFDHLFYCATKAMVDFQNQEARSVLKGVLSWRNNQHWLLSLLFWVKKNTTGVTAPG